jgi:hypothetical protein
VYEPRLSISSELVYFAMGRADTTVATPSNRTLTAVEKRIVILSLVDQELGHFALKVCVEYGSAACLVKVK